jgi:hypothetical protein
MAAAIAALSRGFACGHGASHAGLLRSASGRMLQGIGFLDEKEMIEMPAAAHSNAGRGAFQLRPHDLLYPPIARGADGVALDGMGTLWRPADDGPADDDSLLTRRYFGMQSLQLRLEQLMQGPGVLHSHGVTLFLKGRFDHVYVDTGGYHQLAHCAGDVLGDPRGLPLFFDVTGQRLVIDTSRCFLAQSALPTAAAVQGMVALAESPQFTEFLNRSRCGTVAQATDAQVALACNTLRDSACCVARHLLKEPGLQLTPLATRLARDVGARLVARALFTGAATEMQATVAAFAALWKHGLPATLQG